VDNPLTNPPNQRLVTQTQANDTIGSDMSTSAARCAAVEVVATAVAVTLGWSLAHDALATLGAATDPVGSVDAVVVLCELALVACLGWAWAATTSVVLDAVRGRVPRRSRRGVPHTWRRWVLVACGVALAAGVTVPAQAAPAGADDGNADGGNPSDTRALLAGLPMPDRAVAPSSHLRAPHRTAPGPERPVEVARPPAARTVEVVLGDSLWEIAAATLPPGAGDEEVADRWRDVYRANRDVLGPDPDLISPGQRLTVPPP
jgi:hypothetical protein